MGRGFTFRANRCSYITLAFSISNHDEFIAWHIKHFAFAGSYKSRLQFEFVSCFLKSLKIHKMGKKLGLDDAIFF